MFGLSMMGAKHYILLMPSLTKKFFLQRPAVLSGDSFLHWIHAKYFGDGGASQRLPEADFHTVHKTLNSLLREPFLSEATAGTQRLIEERIPGMISFASNVAEQYPWEKFANVVVLDKEIVEANLFRLTTDYVAEIVGIVLMGEAFNKNNPGIIEDLWTFDSGFGALLTGVPGVTRGIGKAKAARTRINAAVMEWHRAVAAKLAGKDPGPKWGDMADVSETMLVRTRALLAVNAEDSFAVASHLALYWGTMVNANKVIFWMLLEIISTPNLAGKIRTEIAPCCKVIKDQGGGQHGHLKMDTESLMKNCPVTKATFFETMRVYTAGTSYKKVHQDLTLTEGEDDLANFGKTKSQTYHIKAGNFLIIPAATMQKDPRVWVDPETFDPSRFLVKDEDDPKKVHADMLHLVSFGGGASMCKGRLFAEREVLFFIAGLLTVWEFRLDQGFKIPERFYCGTGTANPKTPVRVRMSRRTW
jgi:hypothetical protein